MGEVAICGGSGMEFRVGEMGVAWRLENEDTAFASAASISSSVVMWERFLPKLVMRVLLVESDYSTRHIITALLKKCGYKVVAVGDGLTAWETLRGRPSSIDLILTEVDLPLISGFALLTLIMDHEVCKNIPVIMMSSHDKVSSVYNCMSRGATDFLMKPIRKNELNNLWQHVWRKQASSNAAVIEPLNTSAFYRKDEATAESTKKSSDAQSSCTKPGPGNGGDEHLHTSPQLGSPKCSDVCTEESELWEGEASQLDKASGNSSIKVIDLTGASDNNLGVGVGTFASNACSKELDPVPQMDLLVRKPLPNHSDFSPFSRYTNKDLQLGTSRLMCNQEKDRATISETRASDEQKYSSINGVTQTSQGESTSSHENAINGDPWLPSDWRGLKSLQVRILSNQWDISNSMADTDNKQNQKADNMESNGTMSSHYQNVCSISNSKFDIAPSQSSIEDGYHVHDKDLHFHSQREAALAKFRLKRKDRCFDKKVRYESRKKLAESRPRLKGQFVRQVGCDTRAGKVSVG